MPDYTPTASAAEVSCREFAAEFPTANVLRGVALAESGAVAWHALEALFVRSMHAALDACECDVVDGPHATTRCCF